LHVVHFLYRNTQQDGKVGNFSDLYQVVPTFQRARISSLRYLLVFFVWENSSAPGTRALISSMLRNHCNTWNVVSVFYTIHPLRIEKLLSDVAELSTSGETDYLTRAMLRYNTHDGVDACNCCVGSLKQIKVHFRDFFIERFISTHQR